MKKRIIKILSIIIIAVLTVSVFNGCNNINSYIYDPEDIIAARVVSIKGKKMELSPLENDDDSFTIKVTYEPCFDVEEGDIVILGYANYTSKGKGKGKAVALEMWEYKRDQSYPTEWIDKESSNTQFDYSIIYNSFFVNEVYSDCIIATVSDYYKWVYGYYDYENINGDDPFILNTGDTIKINGSFPDDVLEGKTFYLSVTNTYYNSESDLFEAELISVDYEDIDYSFKFYTADKPVIYLYPEETSDVSVKIEIENGEPDCTYPEYNDGWNVTAEPDGTLTDISGREYYCLFWEGIINVNYDFSEGFCVKGEETAEFLENVLAEQGLSEKEINEFIIYWLPKMEDNEYNLIAFQYEKYTDNAKLEIMPQPDTVIRVFMAWTACDSYIEKVPQTFETPERIGFTVVEWGGTEI